MNKRETRIDIQALRGYAVLIVILFHAKLSTLPSGFLGVDVFFVISGFLITRLIKDAIERNDFSFSNFYFRRAKRLLPAAYTTFLITTLLAPLILSTPELKDLRTQIAGAVTFTGNIALLRQSGYFSGAAELKPLLHVWSLAIEEQYYFVLPALLVFVPRRFWMPVVATLLAGSLALCLLFPARDFTFYLLPSRAWELLIGSVGALLPFSQRRDDALRLLFWPALAVLLAAPFISYTVPHPGAPALMVCLATLLVILRKHPNLNTHRITHGLAWLGDRSYSLYLVHWPLFAFFNNAWLGKVDNDAPLLPRLGLVALSMLLAWLLHRYIEEPIHHAEIKRTARTLARTLTASIGLVMLSVGIAHEVSNSRDTSIVRQANYGYSPRCAEGIAFKPLKECRNSEEPNMLVWGDSYAMHLVPILTSGASPASVVQATRSVCAPLLGTATVQELRGYSRSWAKGCIEFNQSVLDYLKHNPSIQIVVLSSPIQYILYPTNYLLQLNADGSYKTTQTGIDPVIAAFKATVEAVHALGKRVVIVAPPPVSGFDVGRCHERVRNGLPILGAEENCSIDIAAYHHERADVLKLLDTLPKSMDVKVVSFDAALCDEHRCRTELDGVPLYFDRGHFSREGAVHMARYTGLVDSIEHNAR